MRRPLELLVVAICFRCLLLGQAAAAPSGSWLPRRYRDEFNSTTLDSLTTGANQPLAAGDTNMAWLRVQNEIDSLGASHSPRPSSAKLAQALRRVLAQYELSPAAATSCCPSWTNLTQNSEIQDEQRRFFGKSSTSQLKLVDLLIELKRAHANISLLSIDGQPGDSEHDKYYRFFDEVQYYLKLNRIAHQHLNERPTTQSKARELELAVSNTETSPTTTTTTTAANSKRQEDQIVVQETPELRRLFRRQLRGLEFWIERDPTISSFLNEYLSELAANETSENPFELYETFIRFTQFGQHYAQNVSLVRESVLVFDQVCSHLDRLRFPSNLTRPSVQYEMIRRLSLELFSIRHELRARVNERILENRGDIRRAFARLDQMVAGRPEIRLLGDEFSLAPPYFSSNVRRLTRLLDLYTGNNLTELSFYDQLSELPEEFIILGASIAHEYETREVPQYSRYGSAAAAAPSLQTRASNVS